MIEAAARNERLQWSIAHNKETNGQRLFSPIWQQGDDANDEEENDDDNDDGYDMIECEFSSRILKTAIIFRLHGIVYRNSFFYLLFIFFKFVRAYSWRTVSLNSYW